MSSPSASGWAPFLGMIVGVLTFSFAAAPAQASPTAKVLVSAPSAAVLPPNARFVTELAPGLRAYTLPVPVGRLAAGYAHEVARRRGVLGAQPDRLPVRRKAIFGLCANAPDSVLTNVPESANALATPQVPTTKPIAVLDTGVAPETPELAGRVMQGYDATRNVAGSGDLDGHGTQVAAIAAGAPGRFRGLSPSSPVYPIQIYNSEGNTSATWIVRAIKAAVRTHAGVINISGSNPVTAVEPGDITVVQQAIAAAYAQGTITVVAAGNEGKADPTVPGSLPHVLNVGSANLDGTRDGFSNFGPFLDLVVPANNLVVPAPPNVCDSGFGIATGTSFSAPAVAGATAVLQALRPKLTTEQLFDLVRTAAVTPFGSGGRTDDTGFGALNLAAGVAAAAPANEPRELDDDVFWLKGFYARTHPSYLKRTSTMRLSGRVSSARDPQDVVPVFLRKGELLTASAKASPGDAVIDLGVWNTNTGSFDIGAGRTNSLVADAAGLTSEPLAHYRAKRTGTFFVSVEAPDVPDPTDPQASLDFKVEPEIGYRLTLRKRRR